VWSSVVGSDTKHELKALTSFGVKPDGEFIELNFVDSAGKLVCFQMTFDHAQSIAMMLLGLLTDALRKNVGTDKSRYAFPLGSWWIESTDKSDCLIATFATKDGFEVSYAIPHDTCGVLSQALARRRFSDKGPPQGYQFQ
jgi:hypothetical protein